MKAYLSLFFFLFIFCSCKKDSASSTANNTSDSSISAQINGVYWGTNNISVIKDSFSNGLTAIIGNGTSTIEISILNNPPFATGTYNFRPTGVDSAGFVVFAAFNGINYFTTAQLNWSTQQETNVASFEIERSTDGVNFIIIGTVHGAGTSNTTSNYTFLDNSPIRGDNYYRLKAIASNGEIAYTQIIVVNFFNGGAGTINAYYNGIPGSNGNIIVTSNDTTNHIITGTFSFDCVDASNKFIYIRNGKFNVYY